MKKTWVLMLALASLAVACPSSSAQIGSISNPVSAPLYVQDGGTCSTANAFLTQQLPNNASTATVNLAGTFSATVTVRASNNGGATWTTLGTASAAGTTSYGVNGYTHLCADVTTHTSGTVIVTISMGVFALPIHAQQLVPAKAQQAKINKVYAQGLKDLAARNRLQLELAKMDVTIARDQLLLAQACESVAHENGWPTGTTCNPNNPAIFTAPAPKPAPPAKAEEKKP